MTTARPDHLLRASLLHEADTFDRQPYEPLVRRMYKDGEKPEVIAEAVCVAHLRALANKAVLLGKGNRQWQRGDLVLVDGDKEGCVLSVNGTVAQVSMWAAQAAVVNVDRLSPMEPGERVEHPEERIASKDIDMHAFKQVVKAITEAAIIQDADGFYTLDAVIDPTPAIRCKPEVGVVLAGPDGPILTVDPLDGGNVWEVNIGDVVAWHERHKAPPSFMERLDMIETLEASVAPVDAEDGST